MRYRLTAIAIALSAPVLLSGCGNEGSVFSGQRANIAGAASVVDTDQLETIKVTELTAAIDKQSNPPQFSPTLEDAINNYETRQTASSPTNNDAWAHLRNTLQDRVLLASQSRCGFYEEYLKRFQSDSANFFGSLSTILGGAGAIVTGADGARALAGLAGISSGVGAEMQKDLFAGITSTVIVPGIEKRRADILASIITNRCQTPDRYTIGLALAQALQFHSACAMDVGIAEGGNAVKNATNPGAAGLASFISMGNQISQAQSVAMSITKNRKGAGPLTGATIATSITTDSPVDTLLKQLTDMSVSPCPTTNSQPAPQSPAPGGGKGAAAKVKMTPVAAAAPVEPVRPITPVPPVSPAPPSPRTPIKPG